MASLSEVVAMAAAVLLVVGLTLTSEHGAVRVAVAQTTTTWCVAISSASAQALLAGLNYACGTMADCTPIQSSGLCYLPNTIQAHASYAYNSYYQRTNDAPSSCNFSGTATIATTDPSYGSCVYPSSPSSAGGASPSNPTTPYPGNSTPPPPSPFGLTPGLVPPGPYSKACLDFSMTTMLMAAISSFLVLSFMYQLM